MRKELREQDTYNRRGKTDEKQRPHIEISLKAEDKERKNCSLDDGIILEGKYIYSFLR